MLKKGLAGVVAIIAVAVAGAYFVELDATGIGGAVLGSASTATGIRLEASRFRLRPAKELEIRDVEASAGFPGGRYTILIPTLRFEHRVWALLEGELDVERVVVERARVAIVTGLETERNVPPTRPPAPPSESRPAREAAAREPERVTPIRWNVRGLVLEDAVFSFNDEVSVAGVTLTLDEPRLGAGALTLLHEVSTAGAIHVDELSLRATTLRAIDARLSLRGGRLELTDASFESDRIDFEGKVELDLNSIPARHRLSMTARLADVPGVIRFEGGGFGLDAANVSGEGRWQIPAGRFDDAPLWQRLGLSGSPYDATELALRVADGRVMIEGARLRGSIDPDGTLDLVMDGETVTGTWEDPVVERQ